ncbi:hypothetical protein F5888DRAFT_1910396 [Russula emetica]|nr:hypothetical protein F5888DRAFT_1910396 [Russula emetica]
MLPPLVLPPRPDHLCMVSVEALLSSQPCPPTSVATTVVPSSSLSPHIPHPPPPQQHNYHAPPSFPSAVIPPHPSANQANRSHSHQASSHSFCDPGQSFRAPPPHHPPLHPQPLRPPQASPFSPQVSHSLNSASPISHPLHGQQTTAPQTPMPDQGPAAAVYPLHLMNLQTYILDPSHHSQLSSPHHTPHPNGVPSPNNPFFPFPLAQALSRPVRSPLHVQAQLPPRTTPPTHHSAASVEALKLPSTAWDPQSWPAHCQDMAPAADPSFSVDNLHVPHYPAHTTPPFGSPSTVTLSAGNANISMP